MTESVNAARHGGRVHEKIEHRETGLEGGCADIAALQPLRHTRGGRRSVAARTEAQGGRMVPLFRRAVRADLEAIVDLLADDGLGRGREAPARPIDPAYEGAFAAIAADPNQIQLVAEREGAIVGVLQLTFIPGLTRRGAWRGQIEGVRVRADQRGSGLGAAMIAHALDLCRAKGCALAQLTSDKRRADAHRFYARLGFEASHEGFKIAL